jgi:hypothetical protein
MYLITAKIIKRNYFIIGTFVSAVSFRIFVW